MRLELQPRWSLFAAVGVLAIATAGLNGCQNIASIPPLPDLPIIEPTSGTYSAGQRIILSSSLPGAALHYTIDGSTPALDSPVYSVPLVLSGAETVRVIAVADGAASSVAAAHFAVSPLHLIFSTQPSAVPLEGTFNPALAVSIADASGNVLAVQGFPITLSLGANPGNATLAGSTTIEPVLGTAIFAGVTINSAGTGYTLIATSPGVGEPESTPFLVSEAGVSGATGMIPSSLFGLTVLDFENVSPAMPFGTTRSWDAHPALSWSEINPSAGVYNFDAMDEFIARNQARGAEIIYTFGRTPQWASSQPYAAGPYGPGECAPPTDLTSWDNFVGAIVAHAAGRIRYWELWNEPNDPEFYCGDIPTMVAMAQHTSNIIKVIDPSAYLLSPPVTSASGPGWLRSFLISGGSAPVDIVTFHGYWSANAEDIVSVIGSYRTLMAKNGISGKALWDTESSWAGDGKLGTPEVTQQVGFVAKDYLLHWSQGVARLVWYAYDGGPTWGGLWDSDNGASPSAGSYGEVYRWLVGATLSRPCSEDSTGAWTCGLSRPGGYTAEAIWNSKEKQSATVPDQYVEYRDLAGTVHRIDNHSVMVGDQPILLETSSLP